MEIDLEMPAWAADFLKPARYKVAYGGRGSSKSWTFARLLLLVATERKVRILCARELQGSIRDSVHRLLVDQITSMGLDSKFEHGESYLRGTNGSEFLFKGLRHNADEIKSTEGLDICWVEEAHHVSEASWRLLTPTVRAPGSEIWVTFNPEDAEAPTYRRFIKTEPTDSIVRLVNWRENPWFPPELEAERQTMLRTDPDAYQNVWEGKCRVHTAAQVLKGKWMVEDFAPEPEWNGPYFGADWGFSESPTVLVKTWIFDDVLYVEDEVAKVQLPLPDTARLFETMEGAKVHVIRADSARPETINYMRKRGFPRMRAVEKWPGSIEDGVEHLRAYRRIVIHPRCELTIKQAGLWRYKVDRLSGDVLNTLIDADNDAWDAIRYSLAPMIRNRKPGSAAAAASRRRTVE